MSRKLQTIKLGAAILGLALVVSLAGAVPAKADVLRSTEILRSGDDYTRNMIHLFTVTFDRGTGYENPQWHVRPADFGLDGFYESDEIEHFADTWVIQGMDTPFRFFAAKFVGSEELWIDGVPVIDFGDSGAFFYGLESILLEKRLTFDFGGADQAFVLDFYGSVSNPIPEPATLAVLGLGLAGLGLARRRMKK